MYGLMLIYMYVIGMCKTHVMMLLQTKYLPVQRDRADILHICAIRKSLEANQLADYHIPQVVEISSHYHCFLLLAL